MVDDRDGSPWPWDEIGGDDIGLELADGRDTCFFGSRPYFSSSFLSCSDEDTTFFLSGSPSIVLGTMIPARFDGGGGIGLSSTSSMRAGAAEGWAASGEITPSVVDLVAD